MKNSKMVGFYWSLKEVFQRLLKDVYIYTHCGFDCARQVQIIAEVDQIFLQKFNIDVPAHLITKLQPFDQPLSSPLILSAWKFIFHIPNVVFQLTYVMG